MEHEIQEKRVVRMRSSGLDLPGEKHFGVRDHSFQVNVQWPAPSWGCSMGWVMCSASTNPPPRCDGSDPKWGIVRVHLMPATHPPDFISLSTIGKMLDFFLPYTGSLYLPIWVKKNGWC